MRWLLCGLLGGVDKLTKADTGADRALPSANALIASPLRGAWDATVVLAGAERAKRLREDVSDLAARVAALERGATAGPRPPRE
jgi:hypothetical protein